MAKAPTKKKTPAKKATKKAAPRTATVPKVAAAEDEAPFPDKPAAKRKKTVAKKASLPKVAVDTRVITMHGETRLTHHGDGGDALNALIPMLDAVKASGKVVITSIAHAGAETTLHAVLPGHPEPYDANPGIILTIGGNGLLAFDHIAIGLATANLIEEAATSLFAAMRHDEGAAPATVGRRADWLAMANAAANDLSERYAA
jgi:hypothetical protein